MKGDRRRDIDVG